MGKRNSMNRSPGFSDALALAKAQSFRGENTWLVVRLKAGGGYTAMPDYDEVAATVVDGQVILDVPPARQQRPSLRTVFALIIAASVLLPILLWTLLTA